MGQRTRLISQTVRLSILLWMDLHGVSCICTSSKQLVRITDQCEPLRKFLASVPDGGGQALKYNAVLRGFSFRLQGSCVGMVPNLQPAMWHTGTRCCPRTKALQSFPKLSVLKLLKALS